MAGVVLKERKLDFEIEGQPSCVCVALGESPNEERSANREWVISAIDDRNVRVGLGAWL